MSYSRCKNLSGARKNSSKSACERVKFWRDPTLNDLEMLRATYITYSFSRHAHEGFGIAIVESGAMSFEYRGATHIAPAGSIVVTQPGEMHTGEAAVERGWTYRTLLPATACLQQALEALTEKPGKVPYFTSPVIDDTTLNQQLLSLHHTLEYSACALERESCFLWGLTQLIRSYATDFPDCKAVGKEHQAVQQIQDYLHSQYRQNVSLQALADLVELNSVQDKSLQDKQGGSFMS